jgi:FkbM family methyltransferase
MPVSFPEERAAITNILRTLPDPVCIVELGAQDGGDAAWMLNVLAGRNPRCVLVEADKINFDLLPPQGFSDSPDGQMVAIYGAIAGYNGTCDFWENRDCGGGFGSIYAPNHDRLSVDNAQWCKTGPIPCFTFDELYKQLKLDRIDILYVDIHGAEKDMVAQGQKALKHTKYLFIEAVDCRMYEGAATSNELQAMLTGWTLLQTFPWNLLLRNDAYI